MGLAHVFLGGVAPTITSRLNRERNMREENYDWRNAFWSPTSSTQDAREKESLRAKKKKVN